MNFVLLTGRLTKDVELRSTPEGTSVVSCTIAVQRDFKEKDAEDYEVDYINLVVWEKKAEFLDNYCHKGDKIGVQGRWQTRSYDDKDGVKRYVNEVVVSKVELLSAKPKEEKEEVPPEVKPFNEEDLPF